MDNSWKAMGKCSDDKVRDSSSSSSSIFDHYTILREILSRLPIKSLMRFKCVSKHWQFSICQDQGLIDLHFTRSKERCPDLFIVVPSYTKVELSKRNGYVGIRDYKYKQSVLLGNLFESGTRAIRTTVTRLEQESFCYTEILNPVNGLICFVNRRLAAVRILNPTTRESTPWIASSLRQKKYNFIADYSCGIWLPTYFFGFDPVTKQHKVLCTWRVRGPVTRNSNVVKIGKDIQWADFCEVLTVGENTWRYIYEKVPFSYTVKFSVYANGFIYWGKQSIGIPEILNAFDVGQEKFKVIQVPQEIRDKCKNPPGGDTFGPFR
ncbi:hypothetical protein MKW92_013905 [Papaver armeniacum]|nr:hypothetical protein MKW92_013905 [Papaver armeniacum]